MKPPRVVVITGGSAGVGRAAARAFARQGDWVAILARDDERVQAACAELRENGCTALGIAVDVADAAQVEQAAERVERELGLISVWVNNVSTTVFAPVTETTAEEFKQVTEVAYLGAVYGTKAALKRMLPRNEGVIVQTGSALAYRSIPLQSAYCAAKAAVRGFTDALRCELIHERSKVRVTMVHLSAFNTPQFEWARNKLPKLVQPVPPIYQPTIAGEAIVRAASRPKREWWVGWPAVKAILSSRVLPGVGDRMAAGTAWSGQQTEGPAAEYRPGNLFAPVPGAFRARGRFNTSARKHSLQWWLSKHRFGAAAFAVLAVSGAAVALIVTAGGSLLP